MSQNKRTYNKTRNQKQNQQKKRKSVRKEKGSFPFHFIVKLGYASCSCLCSQGPWRTLFQTRLVCNTHLSYLFRWRVFAHRRVAHASLYCFSTILGVRRIFNALRNSFTTLCDVPFVSSLSMLFLIAMTL